MPSQLGLPYEPHTDRIGGPKHLIGVTAARTLTVHERVVRCTANSGSGSYAITLPPVNEAQGLTFTIQATIADSEAVTVQDQDESEDWTDLTLDTDEDAAVLYSDGRKWWPIHTEIA